MVINNMTNDDFSEPPRRADSKNPVFIFFAEFRVRVTSWAPGISLGGSFGGGGGGGRQLSPFFGEGLA